MNIVNLSAALMTFGLLVAAPAFAQSNQAQKQPTQEGGSFTPLPCATPYNANPGADPDCNPYKQRTQNLSPAASETSFQNAGKK